MAIVFVPGERDKDPPHMAKNYFPWSNFAAVGVG